MSVSCGLSVDWVLHPSTPSLLQNDVLASEPAALPVPHQPPCACYPPPSYCPSARSRCLLHQGQPHCNGDRNWLLYYLCWEPSQNGNRKPGQVEAENVACKANGYPWFKYCNEVLH